MNPAKRKSKNIKKYLLAPLAVLVLAGVIYPATYAGAENIEISPRDIRVEWRLEGNYTFHPEHTAPQLRATVTFTDGFNRPLDFGENGDIIHYGRAFYKDDLDYRILEFGLGLLPSELDDDDLSSVCPSLANVDPEKGRAQGFVTKDGARCGFPLGMARFTSNPAEVSIPIDLESVKEIYDNFPNSTYTLVPTILSKGDPLGSYFDVPFEITNGSFRITFDDSVDKNSNGLVATDQPITGRPSSVVLKNAQTDEGIFGVVSLVVNIILTAIFTVIRGLLSIIKNFLILPITRELLTPAGAFAATEIPEYIRNGWVYTRDIMNLAFILVLIFGGIATMLNIEGYGMKKTVARVVIIALIINFSLLAGQLVLNAAQILMNTFISPTTVDEIAAQIPIFSTLDQADIFSSVEGTVLLLFGIVYELGMVVALGAVAVLLLIRLVGVWFLLMIAPVAYVLYITEQGRKYLGEWWQKFLAYAFFAPVMAFFLAATYAFVHSSGNDFAIDADVAGVQGFAGAALVLMKGVMAIILIVMGLNVAKKMGIAGADMVVGAAEKAWKAPGKLAAFGGLAALGAFGRGYNRYINKKLTAAESEGKKGQAALYRGLQLLNPKVAKEAWAARVHEKEEEAYLPAIGSAHDTINRIIPTEWHVDHGKLKLGQKTYYGRIGQQQLILKKRGVWDKTSLSEEEKVEAFWDARHPEDKEAIAYLMIEGRHFDGAMIEHLANNPKAREYEINQLAKRIQRKNPGLTAEQARAQAEKDYVPYYDAVEMTDLLAKEFTHHGYSSEQTGRILSHMQEFAEANTKERELGLALHEWDGQFRAASDFSGYKKLEESKDPKAMLQELYKHAPTVFEQAADGSLVFKVKEYNDKGELVETGENYTIRNFNDLNNAVKVTGEKYDNPYDHISPMDLGYMLSGARKNADAQKRKERGNTEQWVLSKEPAAETIQMANGRFMGFTSYGRLSVSKTPAASISVIPGTRRMQGRVIKKLGLYTDKEGHYQLDPRTGNTDYQTMALHFYHNPDEASAFMQRADLNMAEAEKIASVLNDPKLPYNNMAGGKKFVATAGRDGRVYVGQEGRIAPSTPSGSVGAGMAPGGPTGGGTPSGGTGGGTPPSGGGSAPSGGTPSGSGGTGGAPSGGSSGGGGTAPSGGSSGGAGGSTSRRTVVEEKRREEVEKIYRDMHSGSIDPSKIELDLASKGFARASDIAKALRQVFAEERVNRGPIANMGLDSSVKNAMKRTLIEALREGLKPGSKEFADKIYKAIKQAAPALEESLARGAAEAATRAEQRGQ